MKRFLLWIISMYQGTASIRRARCRYVPTCSQYAAEAIELHGSAAGSWLAIKRLARCQPFGSHGYDPVPDPER